MSPPAIHLSGLTKTFRVARRDARTPLGRLRAVVAPRHETVRAVDGISLTIAAGERVAFIGPNGAGKSTTLKILSGILHPDSGEASVLGHVPWKDRTQLGFGIGTVFGQRSQLWYHLPPRDTFALRPAACYSRPSMSFGFSLLGCRTIGIANAMPKGEPLR